MMAKNVIIKTGGVLLIIFFACVAFSAVKNTDKTVRVGFFPNYPIAFNDKRGDVDGVLADLLKEVARNESWNLKFVSSPLKGCLDLLKNGDVDLIAGLGYSQDRDIIFDFPQETVQTIWSQVFVRPDSNIQTLFDLSGKKVAVLDSGLTGLNLEKQCTSLGVVCDYRVYNSYEEIFQAVSQNDVDAGVVSDVWGDVYHGEYALTKIAIVSMPIQLKFAVPEGRNPELLATLDRYIATWKSEPNSFFYVNRTRWFGKRDQALMTLPYWVYVILGSALLLILPVILQNRKPLSPDTARTCSLESQARQIHEEIHRRKKTETDLLESQRMLDTLMGNLPGIAFRCRNDAARTMMFISKGCLQVTGYGSEEFIGSRGIIFRDIVHPNDRARIADEIQKSMLSRGIYEIEYRVVHKNGGERHVWERGVGIRSDSGDIEAVEGFIADITVRKLMEKELRQTQKMKAIATLAGGIANDFNNILSAIFGYIELSIEEVGKDSPAAGYLNEVYTAGKRAKSLVRRVLAFSRRAEEATGPLLVSPIAEEALQFIRATIPTSIDIRSTIESHSLIMGDASQIQQVFINLFTNAARAMNGHTGVLTVELSDVHLDVEAASRLPNIKSGDYLKLTVADTGAGIAPESLESIFDPYFTTLEPGKGTGMGLATVHGIVRQYGGDITVESELGAGTVFHVYFPIVEETIVIGDFQIGGTPVESTLAPTVENRRLPASAIVPATPDAHPTSVSEPVHWIG